MHTFFATALLAATAAAIKTDAKTDALPATMEP